MTSSLSRKLTPGTPVRVTRDSIDVAGRVQIPAGARGQVVVGSDKAVFVTFGDGSYQIWNGDLIEDPRHAC